MKGFVRVMMRWYIDADCYQVLGFTSRVSVFWCRLHLGEGFGQSHRYHSNDLI